MKFFKIGALLLAGALVCSCSSKKSDANEENESENVETGYTPSEETNTQEVEAALLEDNNTSTTEEAAVAEESTTTTTATAEEPAKAESSANTKEFDEFLASYENYVNKYLDLAKKVKAGDVAAMSKLPELMDDAKEYAEKLDKVKNELTAAQLKKFNDLQQKLMKAMQ